MGRVDNLDPSVFLPDGRYGLRPKHLAELSGQRAGNLYGALHFVCSQMADFCSGTGMVFFFNGRC